MIFETTSSSDKEENSGLRLLLVALVATLLFHGGLLPFTHGNTYDAFIHMFFGDHYNRSWFDPWEPRWYTGFLTVSYPPGTHMIIASLMHLMPLRAAFVVAQLMGLLLLVIGVYRFSLIWISNRAAGYAALALVLASSIAETLHVFGQLPTIFSLGLFLNALPYYFRWIVFGQKKNLLFAVALSAATTSAHHVTPIFGGILFVLPLGFHALRSHLSQNRYNNIQQALALLIRPILRASLLGILMILAVVITVFPYWYWSITDPITQVPIPHGSRENFLDRIDLGIMFFVIPWGVSLLILPYAFYKSLTTLLWPLGLSLLLCFILGTGGTTPIPRIILGGAFDILTLDRFTFWGSIIILPFTGLLLDGLMHGRSREAIIKVLGHLGQRAAVGGLILIMAGIAGFVSILTTIQTIQPKFIDPTPIVQFMQEDEHYRWRYLTLGFGDQFAYLSSKITAQSVDGNYHSARRLPNLTRFSIERLENAKYMGVPGLGSLEQFIVNADHYNLKYIFSNDEFYDPLLYFNGWNQLNRLKNGIVVWEKPDVTPLPLYQPRRHLPIFHAVMWGILPPIALIIGIGLLGFDLARGVGTQSHTPVVHPNIEFKNPKQVRYFLMAFMGLVCIMIFMASLFINHQFSQPKPAGEILKKYFHHLDFREFKKAYALLDPEFRPRYEDMLFQWKWQGGLVNSYGKLENLSIEKSDKLGFWMDFNISLTYLTGLRRINKRRKMRLINRNDHWYIVPIDLQLVQAPMRLQRQAGLDWISVGRRQARAYADVHRDLLDRPRIFINGARVIKHKNKYSLLGMVTNTDYDPAALSIFGTLYAQNLKLTRKATGLWGAHRLLPGESAGFRSEFDGVLSIIDGKKRRAFDPDEFLPPKFISPPTTGSVDARALVNTQNLYRGVSLNNMQFKETEQGIKLTGLAVNTGTKTATIIRINILLYGMDGKPLWVDVGFIDTNIYPGQSTPFEIDMPNANEIIIVSDIVKNTIEVNGSSQQSAFEYPQSLDGTILLDGIGGFKSARINVNVMTHQPLF